MPTIIGAVFVIGHRHRHCKLLKIQNNDIIFSEKRLIGTAFGSKVGESGGMSHLAKKNVSQCSVDKLIGRKKIPVKPLYFEI